LLIPHIQRHINQAERILNGGRLAKKNNTNPDLIYPTPPKEEEN